MLRSRLKRIQPLHPSTGEGTLKRAFVSPVHSAPVTSVAPVSTPVSLTPTLPTQQPNDAVSVKSKSFTSPFKCPQPKTSVKSVDVSSDGSKRYCFNTMYYKSGPKKKKTYLDGILFIDKKMFSLFDPSGKLVRKSLETYDASGFVVGCTIDLGVWCCEIGTPISEDDYISGRVFLNTTKVEKKSVALSAPVSSRRFTLHSTTDQPLSTGPKTYTGLYKQTPESFVVQASFTDSKGNITAPVLLDPLLNQRMKPHQKEGLVFLYNCINGLTENHGNGCILADEMGLGKTLTAISLIFTSLTQSPWSTPLISSAVVTCPSSLVDNWGNEFKKWLGRDKIRCIILKEKGTKAEEKINEFVIQSGLKRVVLIISYEMYRKFADRINGSKAGLLVCDEGHRLKSSQGNATIDSLMQFPSKRRVLLSGTPIQNDMEELFALSEFVNPGIFSSLSSFRQLFCKPIEAGRRKGCSQAEKELATMRSAELSRITEQFILRRTTAVILRSALPPKVTSYIFCPLSPLQQTLYEHVIDLQRSSLACNGSKYPVTDELM